MNFVECPKLLVPKNDAQIFPLREKVYKLVSNSNIVEFNETINIEFSNEMELNINVLVCDNEILEYEPNECNFDCHFGCR